MKTLTRRVARVGSHYATMGCPTCRGWPAVQLVGVPEGWQEGDPVDLPYPAVCPSCGRDPVAEVRVYIGIDLSLV